MLVRIRKKISINLLLSGINSIYRNYFQYRRRGFGFIHKSARIRYPILIKGVENIFLHENTHILGYSKVISTKAKFTMMRNSGSAEGLTVVTGSHPPVVGEFFLEKAMKDVQITNDVLVEEDVWLASNVTLLAGVKIGRGSIVGSGAVCRNYVPPYAIVTGNPAKVVGFKFTPSEIIKHEEVLYTEDERLTLDVLEYNYQKYFIKRLKDIKKFIN